MRVHRRGGGRLKIEMRLWSVHAFFLSRFRRGSSRLEPISGFRRPPSRKIDRMKLLYAYLRNYLASWRWRWCWRPSTRSSRCSIR